MDKRKVWKNVAKRIACVFLCFVLCKENQLQKRNSQKSGRYKLDYYKIGKKDK